jgi:hypothetical protein
MLSDGLFEGSDPLLERRALKTESPGRDWAAIGVGLAGALALVAIFVAGMWALVVLVTA